MANRMPLPLMSRMIGDPELLCCVHLDEIFVELTAPQVKHRKGLGSKVVLHSHCLASFTYYSNQLRCERWDGRRLEAIARPTDLCFLTPGALYLSTHCLTWKPMCLHDWQSLYFV